MVHQHVLGLHVPMHETRPVNRLEPGQELRSDLVGLAELEHRGSTDAKQPREVGDEPANAPGGRDVDARGRLVTNNELGVAAKGNGERQLSLVAVRQSPRPRKVKSFQANFWQAFTKVYVWAALPEILAGIRLGCIRSVKGVIIGQLLVSVVGFGRLFELYSSNFLMEHMWALLFVIFFFAFLIAEGLGILERKFEYYAASRN